MQATNIIIHVSKFNHHDCDIIILYLLAVDEFMITGLVMISVFIHMPQCPSVCELVRHHLSSGSVCDPETNKWHSISDITYLVTADCSSHTKLQSSFVKHFTVIQWDQYRSVILVK